MKIKQFVEIQAWQLARELTKKGIRSTKDGNVIASVTEWSEAIS